MFTSEIEIGNPAVSKECHVHPYDSTIVVTLTGTLKQEGEPVGYYDADKAGVYEGKICLEGNLRYHLCGRLCVSLHVECLGPGTEDTLDPVWIELEPCGDGCYPFDIEIPEGYFTPGEDGCGQVCCFVLTVTSFAPYCEGVPNRPGHINCWAKGPCVMIHRAPQHGETGAVAAEVEVVD